MMRLKILEDFDRESAELLQMMIKLSLLKKQYMKEGWIKHAERIQFSYDDLCEYY